MSKMEAAEAAESGSQRPWVILGRIPLVLKPEDFLAGTEVFVRFIEPPSVTIVSVASRIAPDHTTVYIVAVDSSAGRFLLYATQGLTEPAVVGRYDHIKSVKREFARAYFLCDAYTGTASRLPDPDRSRPVLCSGNVGLLAYPHTEGHYMVAELRPIAGTNHATLLCYSTVTGRWKEKEVVGYSADHPPWGRDGVIAHEGRLWWVDFCYGLLACDPLADIPRLHHVSLPGDSVMTAVAPPGGLDRHCCVRISAGKLRYVQVHGLSPETQMLTMWTFEGEGEGEEAAWKREYQATFSEIWADESYAATKMAHRAPVLAAVNPQNHHVVYFFLDKYIFALDVPARRVVELDVCEMVDPPLAHLSSRFVHAWELPPSLSQDAAAAAAASSSSSE